MGMVDSGNVELERCRPMGIYYVNMHSEKTFHKENAYGTSESTDLEFIVHRET